MFNKFKIGMDIGTKNIKVVFFKNEVVSDYIIKSIPKGLKNGETEDDKEMLNILNDILKSFKKAKDVYLTINDERLITRIIKIPKMPIKEIKDYLDLELQQYIPMTLDNYVVDFKILEELEDNSGKFYNLLVVAVANAIVEKYVQLIESVNIHLKAIDIHTNCILKLIKKYNLVDGKNNVRAFIDMGDRYTNVSIFKGDTLLINRLLSFGGFDLTQSIANLYNLNFEEAEEIKIKHLDLTDVTDAKEELRESVVPMINNFFMDLNRIFEYCSSNLNSPVNEIFLYGGTSLINGITDIYFKWFKVPTKVIDCNFFNDKISLKDEKNIPFLLNAIGVVIREE